MRPFTMYHQFQELFTFLQQQLTNIIVGNAHPDSIFLLGGTLQRRRSESIFNEAAPTSQYISDCSLLIILPEPGNISLHNLEDSIEQCCSSVVSVTAIVITASCFKEWLQISHPFALAVLDSAVMVYDVSNVKYKDFYFRGANKRADADKLFRGRVDKAKEYFAGADIFFKRNQLNMAAFMLHQSAEQALCSLVNIGTGYYSDTHSIERLLRLASLISYKVSDVFSLRNAGERMLLSLLNRSYMEARYNSDYVIDIKSIVALNKKVGSILEVVVESGNSLIHPGISN